MDEELTEVPGKDKKFAVNVTSPSQCKRVLAIKIPEAEMQGEKAKIERDLQRNVKVPGFRKGKVPLGYIKKNFADAVHSEAVQNLLSRAYEEAVVSENLRPLAEPRFENLKTDEGEGISVEAIIEVRPEVQIKDYQKVSVEVKKRLIGDEQVNDTLNTMRERMATFEAVDRPAALGDFVVVDYVPYDDSGEPEDSAAVKNHPVDLSGENLLPEFREGLVGMKAGDENELNVKYPEDFGDKSLAGSVKKLKVTMTQVKEKLLPELDDSFAIQIGAGVDTLDALKSKIQEDLQKDEDERFKHEVGERILDKVIETNDFEIPEIMVENYLSSVIQEDRRRRPFGVDEEQRASEIRELFRDSAVRTIRKYIILEAVGKQESLTLTEEEIEEKLKSIADGAGKAVEEVKQYLTDPDRRRRFEGDLLDQKILDFLRDSADIKVA